MAVTVPEWLAQHGGSLVGGPDGSSYVYFAGEPQYRLKSRPAGGQFACEVEQTVNSRRLDGKETFPNADDAVRGGLEVLRNKLGW